MTDIEQMKAELEASGYTISSVVDGIRHEVMIIAPNEWEYTQRTSTRYAMDRLEQDVIKASLRPPARAQGTRSPGGLCAGKAN